MAQIYRQLKKNYDSRQDYWTANECHFGEMEMKRLAVPEEGRLLGIRQKFHRNISMMALYRLASDYGNNYWKPAAWLVMLLIVFALMLPLPGIGLLHRTSGQSVTYATVWRVGDSLAPNVSREIKLAGKAGIAAIDTAAFQRDAEYVPAYPWGRVLAIITTLLTSTLFALFLLAVRRQFKR